MEGEHQGSPPSPKALAGGGGEKGLGFRQRTADFSEDSELEIGIGAEGRGIVLRESLQGAAAGTGGIDEAFR